MNEFMTLEHQNLCTTLMSIGYACVMIFQSIYYIFHKNWLYLHAFLIVLSILIILASSTIEESPKYHYANKRYHEAR